MRRIVPVTVLVLALCCVSSLPADSTFTDPSQNPEAPYRLFRTANLWTFLKLNTEDGRIWQLQFDVRGDDRGHVSLNSLTLVGPDDQIPGRFTLYPTSNMYTFILLDQIDGRAWQVQWAFEREYRFILPIR